MKNKYKVLSNIKGLNLLDRILLNIFNKYTYKIYSNGFKDGFNYKK